MRRLLEETARDKQRFVAMAVVIAAIACGVGGCGGGSNRDNEKSWTAADIRRQVKVRIGAPEAAVKCAAIDEERRRWRCQAFLVSKGIAEERDFDAICGEDACEIDER